MTARTLIPMRSARPFWQTGLLTIAAAIVANLVARFLVELVVPLPAEFPPLAYWAIALFTLLGVGLGVLVYALIGRFLARPNRVFTIVAVVALVLSVIPNLQMLSNPAAVPLPPGTPAPTPTAALTLMLFHVIAASVTIWMLTQRKSS